MNSTTKEIQPAGVLDGERGKELLEQVSEALVTQPDMVVINCQQITFMDSSGFSALVGCLKKVREAGRRLALRAPASQMKMVLEITGTDKVFECI
ncbi:STAS domain-containing protein [Cyanobium gracile]|uniref:Anti-sigma factor antagonist n=1 Tax=Cyanobium gracile UHCC 0281 TaxID=3110309 RepID=A0ABU5T0C0_9CYAN|nr:STAS domain-containing protein [Cyanobium gracile]MEA5444146.1 STAS domain-containing protein [Cyanobium gracile UHCC 0281]